MAEPTKRRYDSLLRRERAQATRRQVLAAARATTERAAAEIYVLTGPDMFDKLTVTCGWSAQDHQQWLARLLVATLLDPSTHHHG